MSSSRVLIFLIIFGIAYFGLTSAYLGGIGVPDVVTSLEPADVIPPDVPIIDLYGGPGVSEFADVTPSFTGGDIIPPGVEMIDLYGGPGVSEFADVKYNQEKISDADEPKTGILEGILDIAKGDVNISQVVTKQISKNPVISEITRSIKKVKTLMSYDWGILSGIFGRTSGFFSVITDGAIISSLWCLFMGVEIWDRLPAGGTVGTLVKYGVGLGIFAFILLPLPAF